MTLRFFPRECKHDFCFAGLLTYSGLLCLPTPQTIEAVAQEVVKQTHYWSLQQRDCPGLSPDSLFIRALALESHAEQNWGKDKGFF